MREMVDSGLFWAGKIPASWKLMDLKFVLNLTNGREVEVELDETDSSAFPVYGSGGIFKYTDKYMLDGEAVIFGRKGTIDNPIHIKDKFWLVDTAYALTNKDYQNLLRYFYYELKAFEWKMYATQTVIPSIVGAEIIRYNFPIPPFEEQQQIVTYLDARCSKIDGAIAQRKAIIEKLKEYKSAVITKAVTKGLNPNVEMKDSGIEWIGKVPKHWICTVLKRYCKFKTGTTPSTKEEKWFDGDIQWFTPTDCHSMLLTNSERTLTVKAVEDNNLMLVPRNTVLIVGIGATAGNVGITECDSYFNQQMTAMLANKELIPQYLLYWIVANSKFLRETAPYTTLPILNNNTLSYYDLLVPPIVEQQNIIKYLDSQCAKIDEAIAKQEQAVAKLEEYRKSVIYYAVTGKIDCRDKESIA